MRGILQTKEKKNASKRVEKEMEYVRAIVN